VQDVAEYELVSNDLEGISTSNIYADGVYTRVDSFPGHLKWNVAAEGNVVVDGWKELANINPEDTSVVGSFMTNLDNRIRLYVSKGTYGDIAVARIALSGTKVWYQLATPVVTPIQTSGILTTEPSGTVYLQPAIATAGIYSSGIIVLDGIYPIGTLETLYRVDFTTGVKTSLTVSGAVIAEDGLSFTHASLAAGDLVFFTYLFKDVYPVGESTITHYDSRYATTDRVTGKVYKIGFTVAD
jgi:hypothetical protein